MGKRILETLTSSLYVNPIVIFREYVQNSIDSKIEKNIPMNDFYVTISTNLEKKEILIKDNGMAIKTNETKIDSNGNVEEYSFEKTMTSISKSAKHEKEIGYRGIGRLSAMPFCDELIFRSKAMGEDHINVCIWNGKEYGAFLDNGVDEDINSIFSKICRIESELCENIDDHYFEVQIINFNDELFNLIKSKVFVSRLKKILPLRYDPNFKSSKTIVKEYNTLMMGELEDYMCNVSYNGEALYKEYTESMIGKSGLIFMPVQIKKGPNDDPQIIGLMWYSFDQKIEIKPEWKKTGLNGIIIRSKNMIMGTNTEIADQLKNIATITHSEMVNTLRGVSGELLINTNLLEDNASRDWFRYNYASYYLTSVILYNYISRLKAYRYRISNYYNAVQHNELESDNQKLLSKALDALKNLTEMDTEDVSNLIIQGTPTRKIDDSLGNSSDEDSNPLSSDGNSNTVDNSSENKPSEIDIPERSIEVKQFYNEVMAIIENFFRKEKKYTMFDKLRAHIRNTYGGEYNREDSSGGARISEQVPTDRSDEDRDIP